MNYVVLAAFRNRREKTLRFLETLLGQEAPAGARLHCILFDDGSTDGTADIIADRFPDVEVIRGDGSYYWNGAMTALMIRALARPGVDGVLIANDDIELQPGALRKALGVFERLNGTGQPTGVVGAFHDKGKTTYSGFKRVNRYRPLKLALVEPGAEPAPCDTFNGNFVLLPSEACRQVGGMDGRFHHSGGDLDLGYRLVRAGVRLVVAPGYLGSCERGASMVDLARQLDFRGRMRLVLSPLRSPWDIGLALSKHGGILAPVLIAMDWLKRIRLVVMRR